VLHKTPNVFPIVGGRNLNHLKGNIEALNLELSEEDMETIESAWPFDVGFPSNFIFAFGGGAGWRLDKQAKDIALIHNATRLVQPELPKPLKPSDIEKQHPE
jgi:hypothetical protein